VSKYFVYIAGPISRGDSFANCRRACEAFTTLRQAGFVPICPHWSAMQVLAGLAPSSYEYWLDYDFDLLRRCDLLVRLPGESKGSEAEVMEARANDIPVVYGVAAALDWLLEQHGEEPR
jgi:uncharacterized protein DUF4406